MNKVAELIAAGYATVIDVRTRAEFAGGHVAGSINIPLNEIHEHLAELKEKKNLVLCCLSGGRSANATAFLQQNGIECVNGGSWTDVNYYTNN